MTRIEKKACAFLLAFLMSASLFLPFLQETAYAEESEEFMVTETQEDVLPGEAISENEPEVLDVQDENEKLSETAPSSEEQLEPLTVSGGQEEEKEQEEQGVKEQALEEQQDGEESEPSGEENDVPEEQSGDWKYKVLDEAAKTAAITGYTGTDSEIQIPGTLKVSVNETETAYTVVEIGERAFEENVSLINAEIPNTVTTLQYGAFCGCTSLKSVSFENGSALETIGPSAFFRTTSLEGIQCPANLKTIGEFAFCLDSSLTRAELNEGLTEIGKRAFYYAGLESIKIPDTIKSISEGVFFECESLADVTLGKNVEEIGEGAFACCASLTEILLPEGLRSIGTGAFRSGGLQKIDIPDSVTSIGSDAFYGCENLKDVQIGNGLAFIANFAFSRCAIEKIDFGNKVKTIGDWAFSDNQSLTELVLQCE